MDLDNEFSFSAFGVQKKEKVQTSKRVGRRVHHEIFGDGTVLKDSGGSLEVSFDSVGVKKVKSAFLEELFS